MGMGNGLDVCMIMAPKCRNVQKAFVQKKFLRVCDHPQGCKWQQHFEFG
jgi:hypothetical protein